MTLKKGFKVQRKEYQQLNKRQPNSRSLTAIIVVAIVVSVITSVLLAFVYDRYFAVKIVAVDLKGYVARQRDLYAKGKITEDEFKRSMDDLETVIGNVPKNTVVLTSDVVVRNAKAIGK